MSLPTTKQNYACMIGRRRKEDEKWIDCVHQRGPVDTCVDEGEKHDKREEESS